MPCFASECLVVAVGAKGDQSFGAQGVDVAIVDEGSDDIDGKLAQYWMRRIEMFEEQKSEFVKVFGNFRRDPNPIGFARFVDKRRHD